MEEKLLSSQKYFLFKLPDVLNNSFHAFEEKRAESLRLVISLCLDTYEEMHGTSIGTDKLAKSYNGLLNNLAFQLKRHPFNELDIYGRDFKWLCNLIDGMDKELSKPPYELYLGMKSLLKKLDEEDFTKRYVECLNMQMSFAAVDILIDTLVSELLYMGYSLTYLSEWYASVMREDAFYMAVQNNDTYSLIERLTELDGRKNEYEVIIPYQIKSDNQRDSANQLFSKNFSVGKKSDREVFSGYSGWKEDTYACKTVLATDYYKAVEMVKNEFAIDKELFSMWRGREDDIKENVRMGYIVDEKLRTVDIRKIDNTKLISYFDKNRIEQLDSFIELKDKMKNDDVDTLERILHTIHTAKTYNIQNRYLNFWSALEYALYPFPRNSIIEKARTIVSEAFSLFYIKNKMNIFWERLTYTMSKKGAEEEHIKCKGFMDACRGEKDFDTMKVIEFLQNETKYTELLNDIDFHIVLKRELMELIMLVTDSRKLKSAVEEYHEEITHDLDCVYRLRNQLIHSAKSKDDSLEHISLRLYRYVNSIVATILYYKKKNAAVGIVEILNSLHNTYNAYMEKLEALVPKKNSENIKKISLEEGYGLVRPKYLFLE